MGENSGDVVARSPSRSRADLVMLGAIIVGALAVVLVSLPYKAFDLDRFFVPKELALHATAALTGLIVLTRRRTPALSRVDTFLAGFLILGVLSALFAENWWLATRALAITASGVTMFWVTRTLAAAGQREHEGRAAAQGAGNRQVAAHCSGELATDGEPEAGTRGRPR